MQLDLEEGRPDVGSIDRVISWREGVLLSIIVHLLFVLAGYMAPQWFAVDPEAARARAAALQAARDNERTQFVFMQPRIDTPAVKPPDTAVPSDLDRQAMSPQPTPSGPQPRSDGNTRQFLERSDQQVARGQGPTPDPATGQRAPQAPQPPAPPAQDPAMRLPDAPNARPTPAPAAPRTGAGGRALGGGSLGDSLRNLQRYVQPDQFENAQGGGLTGPAIQFDSKGVEFGPWLRRFVAQVKRNWLIPYAAMSMKGHVVITFNVHKDGSITDIVVAGPSPVDAFNNAARNALSMSNPTAALPPEYPSEKAFFTVTFFYNDEPPQ